MTFPIVNPPSADPANYDSMTGMFVTILRKYTEGINGKLPASIVSYDRTTNRAVVQPLINILTTSNTQEIRAQIEDVPVYQYGGGGFVINVPLNAGDIGWIIANDRDISNFKETFTLSAPGTFRIKNFADAVFYPNIQKDFIIAAEDEANLVIQKLDGTAKISISPAGTIKIAAPTVIIEATSTQIQGNLNVAGTVTAEVDVVGNGVSLKTHVHSGVTIGTDNTGVPV